MCDAKSLTYKVTESQLLNSSTHSTTQPTQHLNLSHNARYRIKNPESGRIHIQRYFFQMAEAGWLYCVHGRTAVRN